MMLLSYLDHHHVLEKIVVLPLQSLYQQEVLLQSLQHVHLQEVEPYFLGFFKSLWEELEALGLCFVESPHLCYKESSL